MSDIGGIGNTGTNPFVAAAQRQQGNDLVEQQRQIQDRVSARARESLLQEVKDPTASAERTRERIQQDAGPGERRDALALTNGAPKFARLSDETAAIERSGQNNANRAGNQSDRPSPTQDEVSISSEAQQRLASEQSKPAPGEELPAPANDTANLDTPQARQQLDQATPINRGRNETEASRALGQLLDQFS